MQKLLKLVNQTQFEREIMQKDTDLILAFRSMIQKFHDETQNQNKHFRKALMLSQDNIAARLEGFPIQNIDKLENLKSEIPQVVLLNKQIYEIMFMILQSHPCYLINWIKSSISEKISLFDHHPMAFVDKVFLDKPENQFIKHTFKLQEMYLNSAEQQIKYDEICYLILVVFGDFKTIRNNIRCVNQITMITSKVLEFEIDECIKDNSQEITNYKMIDILENNVVSAYQRMYRLIF